MRTKSTIAKRPELSRRAFWDTDLEQLDFDRSPEFTIIRTMERGTFNDMKEVIRYYGKDMVRSVVLNAESLLPRAQVISRRLFRLHNDNFKCSAIKQGITSCSMF